MELDVPIVHTVSVLPTWITDSRTLAASASGSLDARVSLSEQAAIQIGDASSLSRVHY